MPYNIKYFFLKKIILEVCFNDLNIIGTEREAILYCVMILTAFS
jgi:hypothetical protein